MEGTEVRDQGSGVTLSLLLLTSQLLPGQLQSQERPPTSDEVVAIAAFDDPYAAPPCESWRTAPLHSQVLAQGGVRQSTWFTKLLEGRPCRGVTLLLSVFCLNFSLAQSENCADKPYTLEVTQVGEEPNNAPVGLVGGGNLEYQDDIAVFSDGACLQTNGLSLQAPELRYDQKSGILEAQNLEAQTPRYRFWAADGRVEGKLLRAKGIRATTCKCGDNLRLRSDSLSFDTDSGEIVLEESQLEVYQFGLARFNRLSFKPDATLAQTLGLEGDDNDLASLLPLRLYFDQGLNVGVEKLNLALIPNSGLRTPVKFTVLATALGSSQPTLKVGIEAGEDDAHIYLDGTASPSGLSSLGVFEKGPVYVTHDIANQRFAFRVQKPLAFDSVTFTPFGQIAQEKSVAGLAYGGELRYHLETQDGPFGLHLEPYVFGAWYDQASPYQALGGQFSAFYLGDFKLGISYSLNSNFGLPRFWLEGREAVQKLSASYGFGDTTAGFEYNFLAAQTSANIRQGFKQDFGEIWTEGWLRYAQGQWLRQELIVGLKPNPLRCTDSFSLSPTLGYDFSRQGLSRAGLELHYADCCLIWKLGYSQVILPNLAQDEVAAGKWTFGLELR